MTRPRHLRVCLARAVERKAKVIQFRVDSILGGKSTGSPDTSPSAAASGAVLESGLSGPEGELEYMLRRGRASLPSQPKEVQIRMVERLQAAVVEWQSVVEAADLQPPEVSPGEEDHDPASRSPVVDKNAGDSKAPGTQKDGRRQRKKRGASRPAAAPTTDDEALGAFDALQALQHEQGWDQRHNTARGGGEEDDVPSSGESSHEAT